VWLHGGSYTGGGSDETRLNGTYVLKLLGDLEDQEQKRLGLSSAVVVVPQYRLGALGFLAHEALRPVHQTGLRAIMVFLINGPHSNGCSVMHAPSGETQLV